MKTTFKRFVSFTLSFAFLFLMLGDMSFQLNISARNYNSHDMYIYIKSWQPDGSYLQDEYYIDASDNEFIIKTGGGKPAAVNNAVYDEARQMLTITPFGEKETSKLSGFAVSAGNDAVTLGVDKSNNFTIQYDPNIHLVKVHIFYSEKQREVAGENFASGATFGKDFKENNPETDVITPDY